MPAFTVPTIFAAIDKMTAPLQKMEKGVTSFAGKTTSIFSGLKAELLSFISVAGLVALAIAGMSFSAKAMVDYEKAIASFRTIVSDLSDTDFEKYKTKIIDVAKQTKQSSIAVAQSFEKIAGLNADFAKTAEGLGAVSKASIVLSKASGSELGQSAEDLVGIMNQFNLQAAEADRTINVLAAGTAVGAASITQTAESFKNFGSVASGANISLEESVALIQTLGKYSVFGAEAGTKLRGSVLQLQKAGMGYASGQFNINDALEEASKKINKLSTEKAKDAALTKMFGAENISTGRILLSNIELFKKLTGEVTGTTAAHKAAEINSNTFSNSLNELKNSWITLITSNEEATSALGNANTVVKFLTENLETIVSLVSKAVIGFLAYKAVMLAITAIQSAYYIGLGIYNALFTQTLVLTTSNTLAQKAFLMTSKVGVFMIDLLAKAQWAWNVAMSANPIGLIIAAIVILIGLVVVAIRNWNEWGAALALFLGPIGLIVSAVQSFRRNWEMIKESFETGGILGGLKAIGATLLDAILMPLQQILTLAAKIPGMSWAQGLADGIQSFRGDLGVNMETDESGNPIKKQVVNPVKDRQEGISRSIETQKSSAELLIKDQTGRAEVKGSTFMPVKITSTMPSY